MPTSVDFYGETDRRPSRLVMLSIFVGDAPMRDVADRLYICLPGLGSAGYEAVRSREGRGRSLGGAHDRKVARYWAGLPVPARFSEDAAELSSGEVGALLGTRSVKGIGAALSGTRDTLFAAGIRMDEAATRRTVRGRSVWTGGPRIRQAMHVLEQERDRWTEIGGRDVVPIEAGVDRTQRFRRRWPRPNTRRFRPVEFARSPEVQKWRIRACGRLIVRKSRLLSGGRGVLPGVCSWTKAACRATQGIRSLRGTAVSIRPPRQAISVPEACSFDHAPPKGMPIWPSPSSRLR